MRLHPHLFVVVLASMFWVGPACRADQPKPASASSVSVATQPDPAFHVDIRKTVEYLASDELEGRLIGTPGNEKAAKLIAADFEKLGLKPVPGLDGYFQPFKMTTRVDPDPQKTELAVNGQPLTLEKQYLPLRSSAEKRAGGPVVFAGYGIVDSDRNYDDFAGLDLKGKVALVMRFEPHDPAGKSRFASGDSEWSNDAGIPQKVKNAVDRGALAVLLVNPAVHHDDEGLIPFFRRYPFNPTVPVMQVSVETADRMLKDGGAPSLKELQTKIDTDLKPAGVELKGVACRLSFALLKTEKQVENVAALLPGTGPKADEYVIIGAHYDHLGHGGPGSLAPWSHGIHHGADDNASGVSAMLALADRFAHQGPQPRTLLFMAFTGEEEGLIGSAYFTAHPPIPLDHVAAMFNLDMVGRVSNDKLLVGGEGTAAAFPKIVEQADEDIPLKLGEFGKGGIGPSDHASFAMKKIPVLFFFSGIHMDYHRPTDTADKINYKGMDKVIDLGERVIKSLATMPRQAYNGSFDGGGMALLGDSGSGDHSGARASMGAIPDYAQGEDVKTGMRIGGVMPGSPAAKIGLQQGDVVVNFNGQAIGNMIDYTSALGKAKPGQNVKIKIVRNDKPMEFEATLVKRAD